MKEDDDTFERTCWSKGVVWRFGRGDTTGRSASLFSSHLLCGDGLLCHSYTDSLFVIAWRCWYVVIFPLCAAQNSTPFSLCDAVWCRWPEEIGSSVPLLSSSRYVLRTFVKNETMAFSSKWFYIWVYAAPVGFTSDENHSNKFIVHDRWRITTLFFLWGYRRCHEMLISHYVLDLIVLFPVLGALLYRQQQYFSSLARPNDMWVHLFQEPPTLKNTHCIFRFWLWWHINLARYQAKGRCRKIFVPVKFIFSEPPEDALYQPLGQLFVDACLAPSPPWL